MAGERTQVVDILARFHLFELEDQLWFPTTIRDLATDFLSYLESKFGLYQPARFLLRDALLDTESHQVVDLCSGGGGPILGLWRDLKADGIRVQFALTDKFPNLPAFEHVRAMSSNEITCIELSVDARAVPRELKGFRTMFTSFHHFRPSDAQAVLSDAIVAGQPIGIFEIPERSIPALLPLLLTPLTVLLATPFIRPFRWERLLWTYLLPMVPLTCLWDGLVSYLRAYSVADLEELARGFEDDSYSWEAGQRTIRSMPGHVTYLIGRPRRSSGTEN